MEITHAELTTKDKRRQLKLSKQISQYNPKVSNNLKNCTYGYTEDFYKNKYTYEISSKKKVVYTCKNRSCIICQKNRNYIYQNDLQENLDYSKKEGYDYVFITPTLPNVLLKNVKQLHNIYGEIFKIFNQEMNMYLYGEKRTKKGGYFGSVESTLTHKNGDKKLLPGYNHKKHELLDFQLINYHRHYIWLVPEGMTKTKSLSSTIIYELWNKSVSKIYNYSGKSDKLQKHRDIFKRLMGNKLQKYKCDTQFNSKYKYKHKDKLMNEIIKYALKETDLLNIPEVYNEYEKQFKGIRTFSSGGLLKSTVNVKKVEHKEKKEEKEEEFLKHNKHILSWSKIWYMLKEYYVIYNVEWKQNYNTEQMIDFLMELHTQGFLQEIESKYLINEIKKKKKNRINIENMVQKRDIKKDLKNLELTQMEQRKILDFSQVRSNRKLLIKLQKLVS